MVKTRREELLPYLKERFGERLKPEVLSVKMVQTSTEVYLEYTVSTSPNEVLKVELAFIASSGIDKKTNTIISIPEFNPELDLEENIHEFLYETNDYTIILAIDQIFTPDGIDKIIDESVDK